MGTMSHMLDGLDDQDFTERESKESCGLKHCSHCGKFVAEVLEEKNSFFVKCHFCQASGGKTFTAEGAAREWNRRTPAEWR